MLYHKNNWVAWALAFLSVFLLSCSRSEEQSGDADSTADSIVIGAVLPLTGSGAVWGNNAQKGIDLAVEEVNDAGGIGGASIRVKYEDSQTLPRNAVTALTKLISIDSTQACIVDMVSSNVMAMAPIAEREQVVILSPGASSPSITTAGDFVFRNWPSDDLQGRLNAQFAFTKLSARTAAILFINNEYGTALRGVFETEFESLGGRVIAAESFEQGSGSFRSVLAKLMADTPDLLYVLAYPKEWPLILIQAQELNVDATILGTETAEDPAIIKGAGAAAEGLVYSVPKAPDQGDPRVAHFLTSYQSRYGEEPGICADAAYDALHLLVDAIRENGYSGPVIRDYLYGVKDYHGAAGLTSFDENGDCVKPFVFRRITNGTPETLN